jgi:hypothetical protein
MGRSAEKALDCLMKSGTQSMPRYAVEEAQRLLMTLPSRR